MSTSGRKGMRVTFLFPDKASTKSVDALIDETDTVQEARQNIITRMNLPVQAPDGSLIHYALDHKESGKRLRDDERLWEAGVSDGDHLIVYLPREMTKARGMSTVPLFVVVTALLSIGGKLLTSLAGKWLVSLVLCCGGVCVYWMAMRYSARFASHSDYGHTKALRDAIPDWSNVLVSVALACFIAAIIIWFV